MFATAQILPASPVTVTRAIEGGELSVNYNGTRTSYWFNTHKLSAREFNRIASLKGVNF